MRRFTLAALAAALTAVLVIAPAAPAASVCEKAFNERQKVIKKHGKRAPGRNICRFGIEKVIKVGDEHRTVTRPAPYSKRKLYLHRLRALAAPAPAYLIRTAVGPRRAPAGTLSPGVAPGGMLERIAQCESGGDPAAVSPDGKYRGKYQFLPSTWQSVGGTGDPAAAPEAEQDRRAAMLLASGGPGHWPVCGA